MATMNSSPSPKSMFFEDLHVGQRFQSGLKSIEQDQIQAFAREFDPQPFHVDPVAAKDTFFGELVASGWHTASISMRLMVDSLPIAGGLVGLGGEISWPKPVRPGSTLQVECEVLELRPLRSRPTMGLATVRIETRTGTGEVVQVLVVKIMVPKRGSETNPVAS